MLKRCNLDSESQQWTWTEEGMLMCVASSRCLSASQDEPVKTLSCEGPGADSSGLVWDCDRNALISRSTSMLLTVDGQRLTFTHGGKNSKWKSLEKPDICQEKLEREFRMITRVLCLENITFGCEEQANWRGVNTEKTPAGVCFFSRIQKVVGLSR